MRGYTYRRHRKSADSFIKGNWAVFIHLGHQDIIVQSEHRCSIPPERINIAGIAYRVVVVNAHMVLPAPLSNFLKISARMHDIRPEPIPILLLVPVPSKVRDQMGEFDESRENERT